MMGLGGSFLGKNKAAPTAQRPAVAAGQQQPLKPGQQQPLKPGQQQPLKPGQAGPQVSKIKTKAELAPVSTFFMNTFSFPGIFCL